LRDLRERYPDEVVVIGVHSAKFPAETLTANIRAAVLRLGIYHPVVNDAEFKVWQQYAVRAWPTVILVDHRGKVVNIQSGEIQAEEYYPLIERLISEAEIENELNRSPLDLKAEAAAEPLRPLRFPSRIIFSEDGRGYAADTGNHRIVEFTLDETGLEGEIVRVFGSQGPGFEDGLGGEGCFDSPHGLALLEDTLYVADTGNHAVRAIDLNSGDIRTVAGTGEKGLGYPAGTTDPLSTPLRSPWGLLALDNATQDGKPIVFIAMAGSHQIWLLLDEERLGIYAGSGYEALVDGDRAKASFNQPSDLVLALNHLVIADAEASAIRAVALSGDTRVMTLVGKGLFEFGDIDGAGDEVRLQHPTGLAYSESLYLPVPTVFVADTYNNKIKTLDPTVGKVETLIGDGEPGDRDGPFEQARLYEPEGLTVYQDRLYIADTNNHLIRVADLQSGTVKTLTLRGLERLQPLSPAIDEAVEEELGRLQTITVSPGRVSITLDIQPPRGYKLNPATPITIRHMQEDLSEALSFDVRETVTFSFDAEEDLVLPLDLTIYYCQRDDERLCLLHNPRVLLPVRVAPEAPARVVIPYAIEQPEIP
jgi:DNA-binding beta-propeller fold protein YncE